MNRPLCICLIALLATFAPALAATRPWLTVSNCTVIANSYNDGDSFHCSVAGTEKIVRLYFVDTPETDTRFPDRDDAQAAYFGLTRAQALELGHAAARFTARQLEHPFAFTTRGQPALGSSTLPREYGIVTVGTNDLAELLVANGLARIRGVPVSGVGKDHLARLQKLEDQARLNKLGGWAIPAN